MTRMPYVRMRNGTSVTVWWRAWSNPPDHGAGPVSGYVLYHRRVGAAAWRTLPPTGSRMATVDGLRQGRDYEFRVAAVHEAGNVGIPSPVLTTSTCGRM